MVKLLLAHDGDTRAKTSDNDTPLDRALRGGDKGVLDLLLQADTAPLPLDSRLVVALKNADYPAIEDILKSTSAPTITDALLMACKSMMVGAQVVAWLLEKGANVNGRGRLGRSPLHEAVDCGSEEGGDWKEDGAGRDGPAEKVRWLLAYGADLNVKEQKKGLTPSEMAVYLRKRTAEDLLRKYGDPSALILQLAGNGDLAKVKVLLKDHLDRAFSKNENGVTPLHNAAYHGFKDMAELLLTAGADVNALNIDGFTPLYFAKDKGHHDVAEVLLAHGAEFSINDAVQLGNVEKAKALLQGNRNLVHSTTKGGLTCLHCAAYKGKRDMVQLLIESGADVRARAGDLTVTPMHIAAGMGWLPVAEVLLAHGADIDAPNKLGETPLFVAVAKGHKDMAQMLMDRGAKVDAPAQNGNTPLILAAFAGHTAVVESLLAHQADIRAMDADGNTSLHQAAFSGHRAVAELLLGRGAEINSKSKAGRTPLREAKDRFHTDVVAMLRQHGGHE